MELLTVPLYKSYFLTRKRRTKGQEETTPLSMMPRIAQPLPVTRCGRDVTAESQAFQPERNELPLLCRASRREKKGKPNTTEPLSNSAQCVVITSKIHSFTCNSDTTLLQKILRRLLLVESFNGGIEN